MACDTRKQLGDQVLATCEATITQLNDLLRGVGPDAWDRLCYHPWRLMPLRQFLAMTLQELVLHGWDIRSRLTPDAPLSPESLTALMELITTSSASGFLDWAFRPGPHLSFPLCYRFDVTGPVARRLDLVIEGDKAHIEEAGDRSPPATLHCDTETYLLIMYGRLTLEAARALGRLRIEGDQSLAATFAQWFKGA